MGRRIIQVGNMCALCQETYPRGVLYTCSRCGLMYCGNCVLFEDKGIICLRCAARMVSPKAVGSKYIKLGVYLAKIARSLSEITLSFKKIEEIIGDKLPDSAYTWRSWWSNTRGRMPSEAWLTAGWSVKDVDINERKVTFVREAAQESSEGEREIQRVGPQFKALAYRARARAMRTRKLSRTKIAILQARLKNIERQRGVNRMRKAH